MDCAERRGEGEDLGRVGYDSACCVVRALVQPRGNHLWLLGWPVIQGRLSAALRTQICKEFKTAYIIRL